MASKAKVEGLAQYSNDGASALAEPYMELVRDGAMTIPEAMRFAGVGRSLLYEAMAAGRLPYLKIGGARRIPRRALEMWLAQHLYIGKDRVRVEDTPE